MSRVGWILVVLVLLMGAVSLHGYYRLHRVAPAPQFESAEEHFLYGSVGTEEARGVPYWIWLVLPRIFPEYLPTPGGYASIGIIATGGHEMPIGFSKVDIGVPRVGLNCAFCHTATVRATPTDAPVVYPGAPAHQTGAEEYVRFLAAAASDPRFTADTILGEIAKNVTLSLPDRLLYRFVLIPDTRRALLRLADKEATTARPGWGRGRTDLVSRAKFAILRHPADATIGTADAMPLWHLMGREEHGYLWDRSSTSLRDVVRSAAVIEGASMRWMDTDTEVWDRNEARQGSSLRRVLEYLSDLTPPKYPFAVDSALAASGAMTFAAQCAECHDANGARARSVIPISEIGTDRSRLDAWTARSAEAFNAFGEGHDWKFSSFRAPPAGYVAPPLDGAWLNAPYLHNGSVPTLSDLLEPQADRPTRFWRGYDVYDQTRAGFVSDGPDAQRLGTLFDVTQPGNGNSGHTYGTTLSANDKRALIEYLKTR
jgi:mono/diheme cytochrome c family protein